MNLRNWDEKEWLARFRQEDSRNAAFRELIQLFQGQLYAQVRRMSISHQDCDDILQETFIKAWTKLEYFREESRISTWLYRIALNETINLLNKNKKKLSWDANEFAAPLDSGFTTVEGDELVEKLKQAIELLPPKQKAIFCYRYFDEMPYAEIAQIMGVTEGALKASYHHAAQKIETILTKN